MNEQQQMTVDCLSILLVDRLALEIDQADDLVDEVLTELRRLGQDLVASLDPPAGIRVWLEAHGLSLAATHAPPAVKAWDRLAQEEEIEVSPDFWVGQTVRYRTAPAGPMQQSEMGTGQVTAMYQMQRGMVVTVQVPGRGLVHLVPVDGDVIEAPGGQGVEVPGP